MTGMEQTPNRIELIAYADGELPPDRAARVEAHLAGRPGLRREIEQLRALRREARQALRRAAPPAAEALRARIEALAAGTPPLMPSPAAARAFTAARGARRALAAAAVAAMVLLAAGLWWFQRGGGPSGGAATIEVAAIVAKHLTCAQLEDHFYDARFPRVLSDLPPAARTYLGGDVVTPDLSDLGLSFDGAGACRIGGGTTLHLLYVSAAAPPRHVSLFVQPFAGQIDLAPDRAVMLAGPTEAHPVLAWRGERFVYYLVGDDVETTSRVAQRVGRRFPL